MNIYVIGFSILLRPKTKPPFRLYMHRFIKAKNIDRAYTDTLMKEEIHNEWEDLQIERVFIEPIKNKK